MNATLAQYIALGPELAPYLFNANRLPRMHSPVLEVSANRVKATFVLSSEHLDRFTGAVPDPLLCSLADGVGQLLLEVSPPTGTVVAKKSLTMTYTTPPTYKSGDLIISATNSVDWPAGGDHDVVIEGRNGVDRVLFTAALTVAVS